MKLMKIWEKFKETIRYKYVTCNIFHIVGNLPKTEEQKYWYNKALQDSFQDMKIYEELCESKYKSLVDALTKHGIIIHYNETTNVHLVKFCNNIRDILIKNE